MKWDIENLKRASVAPGPYGDGYGITLRQHFAGLFMANMVSDPRTQGERWDWLATQSINAADALLAELAKET